MDCAYAAKLAAQKKRKEENLMREVPSTSETASEADRMLQCEHDRAEREQAEREAEIRQIKAKADAEAALIIRKAEAHAEVAKKIREAQLEACRIVQFQHAPPPHPTNASKLQSCCCLTFKVVAFCNE